MQKRSLTINGHRTSVALEAEFWATLETLASAQHQSLTALVAAVDSARGPQGLASALRVYVLKAVSVR